MKTQGEWSTFRGQDKKAGYSKRKQREGRRGDTQWIAREKGGIRLGSQGRMSLFNSTNRVSPWKIVGWFQIRRLLVTRGIGFRWRRPDCKGLQIQEAWRELKWRQATFGGSFSEAGERSIWNVGSEDILLVVWILSLCFRCVWGGEDISLSPSFPSTNRIDLRSWGTGVSQAWSLPLMGLLQSPRGGRHLETHPLMPLDS